jgi:16S rRNA (adenine1518-N6/adenine1519-N6)-dimethyltransferase
MWQKYGQHFLHDEQVLWAIAQTVEQLAKTHLATTILEIGPGKWALTKWLLKMPSRLILSEIDESLKWLLTDLVWKSGTPIVWGDVLQQPFVRQDDGMIQFGQEILSDSETIIAWNLPYYITSPILRLFFGDQRVGNFPAWVFLIQEEVAQKIRRDAQKKSYLRWLVNRTSQVQYSFTVKADSFSPPPKVVSAVIVVEKLASGCEININEDRLFAFLNIASPFKRKTLWKIEKMQKEQCESFGFFVPDDLKWKRLEELWWEEMIRIVGDRRGA